MTTTTKQGVRDLGGNQTRPRPRPAPPPLQRCAHVFDDHCGSAGRTPCGHIVCTWCGLEFDVGAGR